MDEKRQPNYRADESVRERDEIGHQGGLPQEAVGQSQNPPTGQGQPGMDVGPREEEPGSLNRQEQGERDAQIRRETQFQDATATPLNDEAAKRPKVTRQDDLFGREGEA